MQEALQGRRRIIRLVVADGVNQDDRIRAIIAMAEGRNATTDRVSRLELDDRTLGANHQGVALFAGAYEYVSIDEIIAARGVILVLDHLQDPQNLGTLFRSADATGVAGVIIPSDRAADVTPAVVNASAGSVEHLRVARVANLSRALEQLKKAGWWCAALDQGTDALNLFSADIPFPLALIVGSEGSGISPLVRRASDLVVSIPMVGRVASLNAATAGSVALFEILRRQQELAP